MIAVFWCALALCVFAEAAILRSLFAPHRFGDSPGSSIPQSRRATEILWGVIPAIALGVLLVATWRAAF
jgi:heme/copper-type cytochrome/quinol oxidase subunit 2